ncbi:uncharacterized protein LOC125528896 isoform X1 [Triticum urartu]|nr:uncharacterized protein LOC125528896 isoform X1 [Triticum urartu]
MDTLYSTVKEFVGFGFKIISALDKAKHNMEECRRIDALLLSLSAIAKHLQGSPNIMEDDLMRVTTEGLDKALQLASKLVAKCKGKRFLDRAFNAKDIAEKLHGACFDVLLNMNAVLLANGVLNTSELAELKEIVAQLRADGALNNLLLAKILQILAARPHVDLPQEVEKLVKDDQISSQIKNKGEAKKIAVASSQNKNKGEAKKTDVARPEGKNQKKNKKQGRSTVVPDASLPDGLPESASADSMGEKGSSTIVAARPDVDLPEEVEKLVEDDQISPQIKNKGKAKEIDVARPEVKIQRNKKPGDSTVVRHAFLPEGLAESASAASVVGQGSSTVIINKKIISINKEPGETGRYKIDPHSSETSKLLEVYPQQLLFPLEPKNKETTGCPVALTNNTNDHVGILIKPINGKFTEPEIMKPHSTLVVYATMKMHAQPPKDTVTFEVLMIIIQSEGDHRKLKSFIVDKLNMDSGFMVHVKNLKAEVYRAMLTPITCDPASCCQIISRSIEKMNLVTSIDAHPTNPWIVMGHEGGNFSIWDYQKQETVMKLQVNEVPDKTTLMFHALSQGIKVRPPKHSVFSVKFISERKWLVVGDGHGYIYVYNYTNTKLHMVDNFRAHDKKSVNSLAAHPTEPYLLSSSTIGTNIKVWDRSNKWKIFRSFNTKPEIAYYNGVRSVKLNPRDTNTFACVTRYDGVKVGSIKPSSLETTLTGSFIMADYLFTRGDEHLMVTLRFDSHNSEIWDLKTQKVVHTLSVSGHKTTWVACHPKLPILVTVLDDGTVCLWDASIYRLEKMVHITDSKCRDLVFVPDTNGPLRLAIAFETMIAIMEVNLPIANTSNASGLITGTN